MSMVTQVAGKAVPVRGDDIDTDRIIPARFMAEITFRNMGKYAFYDARFGHDGKEKNHAFNDPRFSGASLMVVNRNFGCGSSREHAPQSLMRFGIKAIIGESFAEIFAGNCHLLGVPCVSADKEDIAALQDFLEKEDADALVNLNLEEKTVSYADESFDVSIAEGRRRNMLEGSWDTLGMLVSALPQTREKAAKLPYIGDFR